MTNTQRIEAIRELAEYLDFSELYGIAAYFAAKACEKQIERKIQTIAKTFNSTDSMLHEEKPPV